MMVVVVDLVVVVLARPTVVVGNAVAESRTTGLFATAVTDVSPEAMSTWAVGSVEVTTLSVMIIGFVLPGVVMCTIAWLLTANALAASGVWMVR